MINFSNVEKGRFGYIKTRRKNQFIFALLCVIPMAFLLVLGILIFKTKMNYLTVPAMVMVIPMANFLVAYFALVGMDYGTQEQHASLASFEEHGMLLSDLVIVDEKGRRIPCAFAVVYAGGIIGYTGWNGTKYRKEQVEIPVNDLMKRKGYPARMKAYTDWDAFIDRINTAPLPADEAEAKKISMLSEALLTLCL